MSEPRAKSWPRRILGGLLALFAALWILAEDWLWDLMQAAMVWLGRLPPVRWLEKRIAALPPYLALTAFIIPGAILLPFKIAALWLIAHRHAVLGLQVFIVAKVVGTALLAWIFALTKPSLMTIGWFARAYLAFVAWKQRLFAYVRALPAYQRVHASLLAAKARLKAWWQRRIA